MIKIGIYALLFAVIKTSSVYITNCHTNNECGAVAGCSQGWDAVALTEGVLGTTCWCSSGNAYKKYRWDDPNNRSGQDLYFCPNDEYP